MEKDLERARNKLASVRKEKYEKGGSVDALMDFEKKSSIDLSVALKKKASMDALSKKAGSSDTLANARKNLASSSMRKL